MILMLFDILNRFSLKFTAIIIIIIIWVKQHMTLKSSNKYILCLAKAFNTVNKKIKFKKIST
jgi:hypothetical protein